MTVREAKARIEKIEDVCKKIIMVSNVPANLADAVDLLQEYKNALLRAINKAEVSI